jgi:protein transport protein SEC24
MITVPDVADMFMPLLTGFMVPRAEAAPAIEALMEKIPTMFADTKETDAVLGPAIQAGMEALKVEYRIFITLR